MKIGKSGYEGADSMRSKAEKLFGDSITTQGMDIVPSASAPSKTPMRKYAKGGSVLPEKLAPDYASREGTMMPKKAKGVIEGAELTDLHMPKKLNNVKYKKGGTARHQMAEGGKAHMEELEKHLAEVFAKKPRNKEREDLHKRQQKYMHEKTMKVDDDVLKLPSEKELDEAGYKRGGHAKAKTTSTMRRTAQGRTKLAPDQKIRGDSRDVGSIKTERSPKKSTMLKPKPASMGNKKSPLNIEDAKDFNALRKGGRAKRPLI